jgi:hypothetical protein
MVLAKIIKSFVSSRWKAWNRKPSNSPVVLKVINQIANIKRRYRTTPARLTFTDYYFPCMINNSHQQIYTTNSINIISDIIVNFEVS